MTAGWGAERELKSWLIIARAQAQALPPSMQRWIMMWIKLEVLLLPLSLG